MPSAHYRPLQKSFQELNDEDYDDDDEYDIEYSEADNANNNKNNYYRQVGTEPTAHYNNCHSSDLSESYSYAALHNRGPVMSPRLGRQGHIWRRILAVCLIVVIGFGICIYKFCGDGYCGGGLDYGDTDAAGTHSGTGRQKLIERDGGRSAHEVKTKFMPHTSTGRVLNETLNVCSESYEDRRLYMQDKPTSAYAQLPVIYFVTPTYPRREQIPELTRLAHTLLHVARLHWLVANDQETCNTFLDELLIRFGIPYTHLASPMPSKFRTYKPAPRGVANRRAAMQWLQRNNITTGVLYFGDDDNTYDLRLFSEIRGTRRVSMFPVGLIADYAVSGPVVRKGKVVAFLDSWVADRRWPVDMAGFAVNLSYMSQFPNVNMPYKPGYEEDLFLRSIGLRMEQIEPRGNNCTEILVWHTQTKNKKAPVVRFSQVYMDERSNLGALFNALQRMGVASASDTEGIIAHISKNGKVKPHSYFLS